MPKVEYWACGICGAQKMDNEIGWFGIIQRNRETSFVPEFTTFPFGEGDDADEVYCGEEHLHKGLSRWIGTLTKEGKSVQAKD